MKKIMLILGILFISFNLRAPITAVGSLVDMIRMEYDLSNAVAGFITTLPLIAFAIVSPFVAKISNKVGAMHTMMGGLVLILCGEFLRSYTGAAGLFFGTAVLGVGIAVGNVIIPAIIKRNFPETVGRITSIYTSGMCIFAAIGAGISIPLSKGLQFGWKNTLASWSLLTVFTILVWSIQLKKKEKTEPSKEMQVSQAKSSVWRSPLAWWVTLYMGIQSFLFYSLVAWLPTIIISKDMSENFAGNMALLFQLMAIPATILIPHLCDRCKNQKGITAATCLIYLSGMLIFLFGTNSTMVAAAVTMMSLGMGGSISLSITFISLRSPNHDRASELSGMSQSAGYLFAAVGPFITGYIFDLLSDWTIPLILFVLLIVLLAVCGFFAGSDKTIQE